MQLSKLQWDEFFWYRLFGFRFIIIIIIIFHILQTKAGPDTLTELDPLDCLFGNGAPLEEIDHPTTPNKPSGTHNRGHRRSHRRRRVRNHEDPSNLEHAAAV